MDMADEFLQMLQQPPPPPHAPDANNSGASMVDKNGDVEGGGLAAVNDVDNADEEDDDLLDLDL